MQDNDDRMVELLQKIARNTGSLDEGPDTQVQREVNISGQGVTARTGTIDPGKYVTLESDDMDEVDEGGTVTLSPGDSAPIAYFKKGDPFAVLAIGASDEAGVSYELVADERRTIGGRTNSPLGLINKPFSFVNALGGAIVCQSSVKYVAHYDAEAIGDVELAARLHVEAVA